MLPVCIQRPFRGPDPAVPIPQSATPSRPLLLCVLCVQFFVPSAVKLGNRYPALAPAPLQTHTWRGLAASKGARVNSP